MNNSPVSRHLVFATWAHFVFLALAILVPMLVFASFMLVRFAETEQRRLEFSARDTTREISLAVERELVGLQSTLTALALSPSLKNDQLELFHGYATEVGSLIGAVITVRNIDSRQLLNTNTPWGKPLPVGSALKSADAEAKLTRKTVISDVFFGVADRRTWIALVAPILRGEEVVYFLSLSIPLSRVQEVLRRVLIEEQYMALVADRNIVAIATSKPSDDTLGKPIKMLSAKDLSSPSGIIRDRTFDGVSTAVFFEQSAVTGWVSILSVPTADLNAPLRQAVSALSALGLGLTTLSVLLAVVFSRRLVVPLLGLTRNAEALAAGQRVEPVYSTIKEINAIGNALTQAATSLDRRRLERDAAESALRSANENLERSVASRTQELTDEMQRRESVEAQFRQAQKIEAVGQLTGGIAHDFNNMMAIIMGNLQLLQKRLGAEDTNLKRFVEHAMEGARRATSLTRSLLSFSRQTPLDPVIFDANKLVAGMSEMFRRTIPENIEIETVLAGGLWKIYADYNALENALLNLVLNARDAMPSGGKVTIETANTALDDAYVQAHPDLSAGQYVLIAVTDQGEGIPLTILSRVYDPFFTTKPLGQGTGLGLSQVYGYAKQSGGHIKIYSEPKHGTTVKLYLPRNLTESTSAKELSLAKTSEPTIGASPRGRDQDVVLVVEDEDAVRSVTVEMLSGLGYSTLQAQNGHVALELLEKNPAVSMLFTDIVMPGINGRQLADEALLRRPGLKVLFTTGYTRNAIIHNGVLDKDVQLIMKPFTIDALAAKLQAVLHSA